MRSGYYAGRGPTLSDLNPQILEMLYQGIKKNCGEVEAANFVRFTNKLTDLSASAFIVAFEQFWQQNCRVIEISQSASDGMRLDARGDALHAQGFGAIMSAMSRSRRSEHETSHASNEVKAGFIRKHLREIPEDERREVGWA